jgi:hypothetical protein
LRCLTRIATDCDGLSALVAVASIAANRNRKGILLKPTRLKADCYG